MKNVLTLSTINGCLMVFDHSGSGNGWAIGQAPSHWSNASELYVSLSIVHFVLSKNCSWLAKSSVVTISDGGGGSDAVSTTFTRHRFDGDCSCSIGHFGGDWDGFNDTFTLPVTNWLRQTPTLFGWVLWLSRHCSPKLVSASQLGHSPHRPTVGS